MRVFCAILMAAGLLCSDPELQAAELANGIKAVVHDSVVTYQQVEAYTAQAVSERPRSAPALDQKRYAELLSENLEVLLERQLILHDFKSAGYNLPESVIEDEVQARIRSRYGDRATLTKTLQEQGTTYEKFRRQVRDQFIIESMRYKNVSGEIMISPHKIETYYAEHPDDFKVEDMVKVRLIFLNKTSEDDKEARKKAEEILSRIKEGAAFSEMASVYSQGPQRVQGGERDWEKTSGLRKELAEAAVALKPGEVSGVVEAPEACYLILVEGKRPAHVQPLGDVRGEIERKLLGQDRDRLAKQWIERLRKKAFVRYF
jgi:peptidyl-prolyl cis-trans isomerase SurA